MNRGTGGFRSLLGRAASLPPVGYALLLCWQRGWLSAPHGTGSRQLKDGRALECRLGDRTQRTMYLGLFEPAESSLVAGLLQPGDTFVDVGAHIGWFTTIAARSVGAAGQVLAFEPYPDNAAALKRNIALNGIPNVRVLEVAVSNEPGSLSLAGGGDSGAVTAVQWTTDGRLDVPVAALDDAAPDVPSIALLKVDVEGWEAHVLLGARRTLARTRNVLIEINPPALKKAGSSPEEIVGLLRDSGFTKLTPVAQRGLRRLHRSTVTNILASR